MSSAETAQQVLELHQRSIIDGHWPQSRNSAIARRSPHTEVPNLDRQLAQLHDRGADIIDLVEYSDQDPRIVTQLLERTGRIPVSSPFPEIPQLVEMITSDRKLELIQDSPLSQRILRETIQRLRIISRLPHQEQPSVLGKLERQLGARYGLIFHPFYLDFLGELIGSPVSSSYTQSELLVMSEQVGENMKLRERLAKTYRSEKRIDRLALRYGVSRDQMVFALKSDITIPNESPFRNFRYVFDDMYLSETQLNLHNKIRSEALDVYTTISNVMGVEVAIAQTVQFLHDFYAVDIAASDLVRKMIHYSGVGGVTIYSDQDAIQAAFLKTRDLVRQYPGLREKQRDIIDFFQVKSTGVIARWLGFPESYVQCVLVEADKLFRSQLEVPKLNRPIRHRKPRQPAEEQDDQIGDPDERAEVSTILQPKVKKTFSAGSVPREAILSRAQILHGIITDKVDYSALLQTSGEISTRDRYMLTETLEVVVSILDTAIPRDASMTVHQQVQLSSLPAELKSMIMRRGYSSDVATRIILQSIEVLSLAHKQNPKR